MECQKAIVLSAYRETDLDEPEHPTDFSLRYPEDEDYAAACDTMQTYCMEGTPYETPFSRSSAVSLTDLREAGFESSKTEEIQSDNKQVRIIIAIIKKINIETIQLDTFKTHGGYNGCDVFLSLFVST